MTGAGGVGPGPVLHFGLYRPKPCFSDELPKVGVYHHRYDDDRYTVTAAANLSSRRRYYSRYDQLATTKPRRYIYYQALSYLAT